ncbi:MAG: hypothetical protein R3189_08910 [Thiomicrorhabdus chilensis]|uniref:hypothetical protein n=1 Tax=Thiomicrorhabdus chilensis TaxID=63656 RepID=UPI00299DDFFD|nr:hypothetical protein [Thiomicrorhabdus chilensis]MDX1348353.1 hypothetical protein [Thiomicrorhabdus chilensis]
MASVDETFDPNDLDSIDALLDEAEQEVSEGLGEDALPDEKEQKVDVVDEQIDEPELEAETKSVADDEPLIDLDDVVDEPARPSVAEEAPVKRVQDSDPDPDDFLSKRSAAKKQSKNGLSAAEMDAIKKLIIIFGSTLIVLALIAISIGIWGAISASSGLDDETHTMIEDIKAGTERNTLANSSSSKAMQSIEKKMDALSFQIEQLTADITALDKSASVPSVAGTTNSGNVPGGANNTAAPQAQKPVQPVAAQMAPVVQAPVATNPVITDKLNSIYSKMSRAQKRIDEVNKRVKQLQGQYSKVLHSIKLVEKQMIDQQVKAPKAEDKAKPAAKAPGYQYSAPYGEMYDQANPDSYP